MNQYPNGYFKVPAELMLEVNQILSAQPYGQVMKVMNEIGQCQIVKPPIQNDGQAPGGQPGGDD